MEEQRRFEEEVRQVEEWWRSPRFAHTVRPYGARSVVPLRSTLKIDYPSNFLSKKLWNLLEQNLRTGKTSHTFGALDPIQVTQMVKYVNSIYVSGWQCSSTASTTNEPGPDLADYPMNTVPNKVDHLFKALLFHDRKQREERSKLTPEQKTKQPPVDYLVPMIADADTGHGGITAVMKLTKLFIEAGAAGIHFEDQAPGTKKCVPLNYEILTRIGFMKYTEVARHFESGNSHLEIAAYEKYQLNGVDYDRLVYLPITADDVITNRATRMIEFSYENPDMTGTKSFRMTADHTVYAHYALDGSHYGSQQVQLEARELLTYQPTGHRAPVKSWRFDSTAHKLAPSTVNDLFNEHVLAIEPQLSAVKMLLTERDIALTDLSALIYADELKSVDKSVEGYEEEVEFGEFDTSNLKPVDWDTTPMSATAATKLRSFFELFGFFLSDGRIINSHQSNPRAAIFQTKPAAVKWIYNRFRMAGIAFEVKRYAQEQNVTDSFIFIVRDDAVNGLLVDEYKSQYYVPPSLFIPAHKRLTAAVLRAMDNGEGILSAKERFIADIDNGAITTTGEGWNRSGKWIPAWVWLLPAEVKLWIITGMIWADGDINAWFQHGHIVIMTSSVLFRDQLVHLLLESGHSAIYSLKQGKGTSNPLTDKHGDREIHRRHDFWRVLGSVSNTTLSFDKQDITEVTSVEDVWCVQLPRIHRIIVRNNEDGACGIPIVIGNCGHMAGKVLVPIREHIDRLVAARLQADILHHDLVIVARTDSEAATLLSSNVDPRDHPFILGSTNADLKSSNEMVRQAQARGASEAELEKIQADWNKRAGLSLYRDVVEKELRQKFGERQSEGKIQEWRRKYASLSHPEARELAESLGAHVFWCWEAPRTAEGYYRVQGGTEYAIARSVAFAPYCDMNWMETAKPILDQARRFAQGVKSVHPHQKLCYNLSPSFNWDAAGMSDDQIRTFISQLGELGYVWQFITLAGFHSDALGIDTFARDYARRGMLAYVEGIQREERKRGVETLAHQKWSGAYLIDQQIKVVQGATSSTCAMGDGVTEKQFVGSPKL